MEKQFKKKDTSDLQKKPSTDLNISMSQLNLFHNPAKIISFDNYVNVMKNDIVEIQKGVNENSHILNFVSLTLTLNKSVKQKITEIKKSKDEDLSSLMSKLNSEASNTQALKILYKVSSDSDLIEKLAKEVMYFDMLLKKINNYFFVIYLNYVGQSTILDNISNVYYMVNATDKMKEKIDFLEKQDKNNTREKNKVQEIEVNKSNYNIDNKSIMLTSLTDLKSSNYFTENMNRTGGFKYNNYNETGNAEIFNKLTNENTNLKSSIIQLEAQVKDLTEKNLKLEKDYLDLKSELNKNSNNRNFFTTNVNVNIGENESEKLKTLSKLLEECKKFVI